jgi:hypothetical protein
MEVAKSGTSTTTIPLIKTVTPALSYLLAYEAHAPLFWESEPLPRFAQTPLSRSG